MLLARDRLARRSMRVRYGGARPPHSVYRRMDHESGTVYRVVAQHDLAVYVHLSPGSML